ncbi:MAG: fumarylacetoacetate hydrolase family protein [Thermoproteota archaeon]
MKLARFLHEGKEGYGLVCDDAILPASHIMPQENLPKSLDELISDEKVFSLLIQQAPSSKEGPIPIEDLRLLHPISRPGKIVCVGLNYRDHAKEAKMELPKNPIIFIKGRNALAGPFDPIIYPPITKQLDYEGELAVVIGKRGKDIARKDALNFVAGYMISNDVSARDIQMGDGQWTRGKTLDTFAPCGPWITTADEIGDPTNLSIRTYVDGERRQDGNTKDMVFGVAELIELLSRGMTFEPGDILLTGTPAGVAHYMKPKPIYLSVGNRVRVEITGLGYIENKIVYHEGAGSPSRLWRS